MKSILCNLFSGFLFLLVLTNFIGAQDNADLPKIFEEINNKLEKMIITDDVEGMMELYTDDAVSMPSYQPMIKGTEAIRKNSEAFHNNPGAPKFISFELSTKEVFSCGELAVEIGTYTLEMEMPGAPEKVKDNGKYLNVFEKQSDGSWKLKVDTWNTDNNPWEMMQGNSDEKEM